jgi:Domain of unknown function (DUF1918)
MIMQAEVGDELTIRGRHQGDEERRGKIVEIHGQDGSPPYRVRWRNDRESIFFPTSGAVVEHHPAGKPARERRG